MSDERFLILPGYTPAGLSNQRMELEVKAALAMLTGRTLVLPGNVRACLAGEAAPMAPTMLDVFETPFRHTFLADFQREHPAANVWELPWRGNAPSAVFVSPEMRKEEYGAFANGRERTWSIDADLDEELACGSPKRMLSWYSYFFFVSPEERGRVRALARSIRPLPVYREFADGLARGLGKFNAVHIRRGDLERLGVALPDAAEILRNIEPVFAPEDPLVICTDERDTRFYRPVFERYRRACFAHDLFEESGRWQELPFSGPCRDALVTQLLAARAREFAGTLYSTFTGYIHRERLLERQDRTFRFVSNPFPEMPFRAGVFEGTRDGVYSWNRLGYPVDSSVHSWFREWPEA